MRKLTKKEVLKLFRESHTISRTDSIMNRENFNNFIDYLAKDRRITWNQVNTWTNPY